jgi:hypothetical protein
MNNRMYRTLINVLEMRDEAERGWKLQICIPGWNPHLKTSISASIIPKDILDYVKQTLADGDECWLICKYNASETHLENLKFEDFELPPEILEIL